MPPGFFHFLCSLCSYRKEVSFLLLFFHLPSSPEEHCWLQPNPVRYWQGTSCLFSQQRQETRIQGGSLATAKQGEGTFCLWHEQHLGEIPVMTAKQGKLNMLSGYLSYSSPEKRHHYQGKCMQPQGKAEGESSWQQSKVAHTIKLLSPAESLLFAGSDGQDLSEPKFELPAV